MLETKEYNIARKIRFEKWRDNNTGRRINKQKPEQYEIDDSPFLPNEAMELLKHRLNIVITKAAEFEASKMETYDFHQVEIDKNKAILVNGGSLDTPYVNVLKHVRARITEYEENYPEYFV